MNLLQITLNSNWRKGDLQVCVKCIFSLFLFLIIAKKDVIANVENEAPSVGEDEETVEVENIEGNV